MPKLALVTIAAALGAGAAACQQDLRPLEQRMEDLSTRMDRLSKQLDLAARGGGGRGAAPPARPEPAPDKTYAVRVDGDPAEGPPDAKVTIVKAYDYLCPYCERSRNTMAELRTRYGDDLRIVYKQLVVHPPAEPAHLAACAAQKQGKFTAMDAQLWERGYAKRQYDDAGLAEMATAAGLDVPRFTADAKGDDCKRWLQKDQAEMAGFGVHATPAFFINGRYMLGLPPTATLVQLIDEELKKANDRIAAGTKAGDYYATWVVEKGAKTL
jgi:protein-disulfide isomerase